MFLVKLVNVLLSDPELAVISNQSLIEESYLLNEKVKFFIFLQEKYFSLIHYKKQQELVSDLTLVSSNLMWAILNFLKMASWSNAYFNFDTCIDLIEKTQNLVYL